MPGALRLAAIGAADAVRHVLCQVHPKATVRAHSMAAILELLSRLLDKLGAAARAARAAEGDLWPVSAAHISAAIVAVLPGELATHAESEVGKASAKVVSGDERGGLVMTTKLLRPAISAALTVPGANEPDEKAMTAAAAALEYLCAEIWELAGSAAQDKLRSSPGGGGCASTSAEPILIVPDDLRRAILKDEELASLGLFRAPPAAATPGVRGCSARDEGSGVGLRRGGGRGPPVALARPRKRRGGVWLGGPWYLA